MRPIGDRVLVQPLAPPKKTEGGLHIPENAKEKQTRGKVVAVGPGVMKNGKRVPPDVSEGDTVLYGKYTGNEIQLHNEDFVILNSADIIGVIEDDDGGSEG